ncbi:DUF2878 domain-containing protein [Legionella taurinensis]|uniref:DUF2878 domain-containing protein n=1 Tax=Legionella taurinensis TaxID=70611 RepID=A0A3A5LIU9_9GAMM|nr:hypothetical protein DB744_06370 [Legionella taurinensis]PUT44301.1 hypothetical protein DB746_04770 [Legionella taurinensis]PUT47603.1 hypothetical protein DB743_02940 [Legionella taurinensis]PUT48742.1 hypothetical protein DB745_04770 [Legionella taurinensis]RJT46996.1 DUF2878 domain-containing protein [Legionella taurinensis]
MVTKKAIGIILHGALYYLSWVACVYFAHREAPWTGPLLTLLLLLIQALWEKMNGADLARPLLFTLCFGVLGAVVDSVWLWAGLIVYKANPWAPYVAAPWIIALWLSFAFYLIVTYETLFTYYKTFGFLALIGVPIAYWLGVKIGAALPLHSWFYIILGCFWAMALPLFLWIYHARIQSAPQW